MPGKLARPIVIDVRGTPAPKGSMRAILRAGRAVLVPSGSEANRRKLHAWNLAVRDAALEAIGASKHVLGEPKLSGLALDVAIVFRLERPKRPQADAPIAKPDVDKLARAACDSLTGIVWDDDSRVVKLTVEKRYASEAGATITVMEAT